MFNDINSKLYYNSAKNFGLSVTSDQDIGGFYITLNNSRYYFRGGMTPFNADVNSIITNDRPSFNMLLQDANLPVPKIILCNKNTFVDNKITDIISNLKFPLAVRPLKTQWSHEDVIANINCTEALSAYLKKLFYKHDSIIIEEYYPGLKSYRVLVFYGKVLGVIQRYPNTITGDGVHTIAELVAMQTFANNQQANKSLLLSEIDEEYNIRLKDLNLTYDSILEDKKRIFINYTSHPSRGGVTKSLGQNICAENAKLLIDAAKILGINLAGFDLVCENILKPITTNRGFILSASASPDLSDHELPIYGIKNPVSKVIINKLIWQHPISYFMAKFNLFNTDLGVKPFYVKAIAILSFFLLYRVF